MYDLIGLEPDDFYDDEDFAVAGLDDYDDYDEDLDAIAGFEDDFDDEDLDAIAGAYELVGLDLDDDFDDEDLDAIAGFEDDFDDEDFAIAGDDYPIPGSVEELLDVGATAGRRARSRRVRARRPRRRVRRGRSRRAAAMRARAARARRARARARRTTHRARRAVRSMGRRVQRERAMRARAVRAARRARGQRATPPPPRPARTIPNVTGGTTQVVNKQPQVSGPQVVPFTAASPVAPGETRVLTARPQVVFRPNQFQVAGRVAEYFRINAIRIGNQNQFAASGSVPAEAFSGNHPMPIGNTTAHPGHDIAIEVTNISASPQDFSAAMSGPALQ